MIEGLRNQGSSSNVAGGMDESIQSKKNKLVPFMKFNMHNLHISSVILCIVSSW